MIQMLTHPTESGGFKQLSLLPTRLEFPCASAWDIPTQREVNAVIAAGMASRGETGEATDDDARAVFAGVDADELERLPKTETEYGVYAPRPFCYMDVDGVWE